MNNGSRKRGFVFLALLGGSLISGCAGVVQAENPSKTQFAPQVLTAVAQTLTALPLSTETPEPTQIIETIAPSATPSPTWEMTIIPTQDALRIEFPTPGPIPVSAWRPPLYEVPFSLTDHDHFYLTRPISVDTIHWPVEDYRYGGMLFGPDIVHTGIDIDAPDNTPVRAAGNGTVIWAGYGLLAGVENAHDDYGMAVAIKHDFGYNGDQIYTLYAHMSEVTVVDNQTVKAGDQIGMVGSTGQTTGPHLHFEVRLGKNLFYDTRNPELWIAPPQGWGVLAARIMDDGGNTLNHVAVQVYNRDTGKDWNIRTYSNKIVNPDVYYKENLVLGDLSAGSYRIRVDYGNKSNYFKFEITPGHVTHISFTGLDGFALIEEPIPEADWLPTNTP